MGPGWEGSFSREWDGTGSLLESWLKQIRIAKKSLNAEIKDYEKGYEYTIVRKMMQVNRNCKTPETFIKIFQIQLMECENIVNFSGPMTFFYFYKATFKEAYIFISYS